MSAMMRTLNITINGKQHEAPTGAIVLDAIRAAGLDVPRLCHDDRIKPAGACRMCVVRIEGQPRPVASCTTPLADGMVIETHSADVEALRRTNLSLIAKCYPADAVKAEPRHPFHELLAQYGVEPGGTIVVPAQAGTQSARTGATRLDSRLRGNDGSEPRAEDIFHDDTHPFLGLAMDRCIDCYRCVRICEEVQGQDIWQVWGRGPTTKVAPRGEKSLLDAGCVSCGACSDTCPTGAIIDKREVNADKWTRTTCVYCGVGCQMNVGIKNGKVVASHPVNAAVNRGHLCVKGRYGFDFNHAPDRITTPMMRRSANDEWQACTWDEALDEVASRLKTIIDRDSGGGPHVIGMLGSARATNEENYYAQKFARIALGTHNVDCCARVCHQPTAAAMKMMLGTGAATNSFDCIEQAATFMIAGCNPTENHPIVGARIRQAVRNGAKLIVVDPRQTELAAIADFHLRVHPGGNIALFNAMAAAIIEENLVDHDFLARRVDGFDEFIASVESSLPEAVENICGVPADQIRAAARLYATRKPAMCFHGLGMTEHLQGTEGVMTLINLALLTGNIGRPGSGINPLRGQNNVQGSAHMGCEPNTLTGGQSLQDENVRQRFENVWGVTLPTQPGMNLLQWMDAARDGRFKALWAFGYDAYLTLANEAATADAMANLELVIVQDLFMNKTAERFGHIFLPAASVFEKDGTFMNSDRRVQRIRAALPPAGDSRPDAWIIAQVATRLGFGEHFAHGSAEEIWNEIRAVWPGGAGLSYARLEKDPPQWPCPDESHPGTPVLHGNRFAHAERTSLRPIPYIASPEVTAADYPFRLTTGRHLYQFNAGTMTQRTAITNIKSHDELEISQEDAQTIGLTDGDWAAIESRYGRIELPVRICNGANGQRLRRGELFTSFHHPDLFVNRVTSPVRDRIVDAPEYKLTAVRVMKAER
jgi:formate dehydrogenase major subunit